MKKRKNKSRFSVFGSRLSTSTEHRAPSTEYAFTLIELLITSSIFALISFAIYSTFDSGMNVWRRARELNLEQRKVILRLERLSREIRQTFAYQDIWLSGSQEEIVFPQVLDSELVRITYSFNDSKNELLRGVNTLEELLKNKNEEVEPKFKPYLSEIKELKFSYFYFDSQEKAYLWKQEWVKEVGLPKAIKIEITTEDENNYAETIFIPTA